jgi:hypothetical protein
MTRINDKKISTLIYDVQSYAKPEGRIPTVPLDRSARRLSFVQPSPPDRTGPDRTVPPWWFENVEAVEEEFDQGPAISVSIDLPSSTAAEEQNIAAAGIEALATIKA